MKNNKTEPTLLSMSMVIAADCWSLQMDLFIRLYDLAMTCVLSQLIGIKHLEKTNLSRTQLIKKAMTDGKVSEFSF